jgi:hypothetical protein
MHSLSVAERPTNVDVDFGRRTAPKGEAAQGAAAYSQR